MTSSSLRSGLIGLSLALSTHWLAAAPLADAPGGAVWPSAGGNIENTRFQAGERRISVASVGRLAPKWVFTTEGDVSATPAVDARRVYFPDGNGNLYAVNRRTGVPVWQVKIAAATGVSDDMARATPAVSGDTLIVGTTGTRGTLGGGANLLAYSASTGNLLWSTRLDSHPAALITQSATVFGNRVYVGVSSLEEVRAVLGKGDQAYPCCSFRGSMVALDIKTGAVVWQTYTVPPGYSGGSVWGSSPAIDAARRQLYIATGDNYSIPADVRACAVAAGPDPDATRACFSKDDHFDSVLALDLATGAIRWAGATIPIDVWNADCVLPDHANCPAPQGKDYDFSQAPALFTATSAGTGRPIDLVGAGQKSGIFWAFHADTGALQWQAQAGPPGLLGGMQWGSAFDGRRLYTSNANGDKSRWTLPDGSSVRSGVWSALDPATGKLLWQVAPPDANGGSTAGPVTTANGVVFGCALDSLGYMYALDAKTGALLWQFASGGSCLSGAAISDGEVFWGSGYTKLGTSNQKLYAFELK